MHLSFLGRTLLSGVMAEPSGGADFRGLPLNLPTLGMFGNEISEDEASEKSFSSKQAAISKFKTGNCKTLKFVRKVKIKTCNGKKMTALMVMAAQLL
jgi:hypothetical protein